jgi:hypothetical protein
MPLIPCDGRCTNPTSDQQNCGGCGNACPPGQNCMAGTCSGAIRCPVPTLLCNGRCVNTLTDLLNCGACGVTCGVTQVCLAGVCR